MKALLTALLLALASHSGAARASAEATAAIAHVTLAVIDLTPADGRAAGYTLTALSSRLIVDIDRRNSGGGGDYQRSIRYPLASSASALDAAAGTAQAQAATTGAAGAVSAQASADASLGLGNAASGESEQRLWLTLAPHTQLTVSGTVWTQASRTLDGAGYRVYSWAAVDISDRSMTTASYLSRESALIWGVDATEASNDAVFLLAYANRGDAELVLSLNFLAYAHVAVTAVPEPATWAMLLAGLLLTGGMRTRARGCRPDCA